MKDPAELRYLLLQVRNPEDPMRQHEVGCFARELGVPEARISVVDLITAAPPDEILTTADAVLFGGSGDYSVAAGGAWLDDALRYMRHIVELGRPTFASCWGFQALARALGGTVVADPAFAELGTLPVELTAAGRADPLFGPLGSPVAVLLGHQDTVVELPPGVTRLASSARVENEAFRVDGALVYATQFHPELTAMDFDQRIRAYPAYIERITGLTYEAFIRRSLHDPGTDGMLRRFAAMVAEAS